MKRLILSLVSSVALISASAAQTVVLNFAGPSGSTGITAKSLSDDLNKKGYNTDLKFLNNNCVLWKNMWDSAEKAISVWDTTYNAGTIANCDVPTTKENFLVMASLSPVLLCNAGNGKTLEDFKKAGANWTIGDASTFPKYVTDKIAKENKNNIKTVLYATANEVATAAKAGELDFIWANGSWPETQLNAKCFVASGINEVPGIVKASDVWPNLPETKITYGIWLIAKGFQKDELAKLKKDAKESWETSTTWVEMRRKRNFIDAYVDKLTEDQAMEIINRDREIWRKAKQ
jgi:hypothetical protein